MAIRAEDIVALNAHGAVDLDRDRLLVVRHQRGEDDAFDELYRRYHRRLVAFCERRVGDRHTAEELAQESFVRALRAMPSFAGDRNFYPWMTVIARRLCIDHHRRNHRVEPAAEVDTGAVEPDHDALWDAVDHGHLALAMERLAPRHREILELREHRGWAYQQIAEHLEVPVTTIEALLHRARKALRREYARVTGEEAGRFAGLGGLAALVARVRTWASAFGPERWIPTIAATAAGLGALGLAVAPGQHHAPSAPQVVETAGDAAAAVLDVPTASTALDMPATVVAITVAAPSPASTTSAPAAATTRPAPALEAGPVAVFADDAGQAYVDEQVDAMPVVVDLVLVRLGIDPATLLGLTPPDTTSGDQP